MTFKRGKSCRTLCRLVGVGGGGSKAGKHRKIRPTPGGPRPELPSKERRSRLLQGERKKGKEKGDAKVCNSVGRKRRVRTGRLPFQRKKKRGNERKSASTPKGRGEGRKPHFPGEPAVKRPTEKKEKAVVSRTIEDCRGGHQEEGREKEKRIPLSKRGEKKGKPLSSDPPKRKRFVKKGNRLPY